MQEMVRLDFLLPDTAEIQWSSGKTRAVWEPRFTAASAALDALELKSVVEGLRQACTLIINPRDLPERTSELQAMGIGALPLYRNGAGSAFTNQEPPPGESWTYTVLAYRHGVDLPAELDDDHRLGELLGYPPCCVKFFCDTWVDDLFVDTTWPMAASTEGVREIAPRVAELDPYAECNILGRWYGLKPIPYLPCSFRCDATRDFAKAWSELGRRLGYADEMDTLEAVTSWPVEWSALHGYAEVKTPVMRLLATTTATPYKYVVRANGSGYPDEGATGLSFPWRKHDGPVLSQNRTFRSFHTPEILEKWYYADNGFDSYKKQMSFNRTMVEAIKGCAVWCDPQLRILNLDCGNGAMLLEASEEIEAGLAIYGVDVDEAKLDHARTLHKGMGHWTVSSAADHFQEDAYDLLVASVDADWLPFASQARWVALYQPADGDGAVMLVPGLELSKTFADKDAATVHLWGRP